MRYKKSTVFYLFVITLIAFMFPVLMFYLISNIIITSNIKTENIDFYRNSLLEAKNGFELTLEQMISVLL
jgi:hypothetical protein